MHAHCIYNGSSMHLGFCEPITKNEKIEKSLSSTATGRVATPACTTVPTALESHGWGVLQEMFLASRRQFLRMAYVVLRNREDAEDALQDALISPTNTCEASKGDLPQRPG